MKKSILFLSLLIAMSTHGQENIPTNQASFELGRGLNFSFNENAYQFAISGMIQPSFAFTQMEDAEAAYYFNSRRTYLNFSGRAAEEKVSFFVQMDFSLTEPLLDAWIAYHATEKITFSAGQRQTIANNREMQIMEDKLQFADRSQLSTAFSNTGREFGIFGTAQLQVGGVGITPQIAVTSGDGRNSFGTDSRDIDLGGFKYGGRLDIYPLGYFSKENENIITDLIHEPSPKMVVGAAASYNDGASNYSGEGHGDFSIYDGNGDMQLPDYRQLYLDILMKYRGFSVLGEYVVATATSLEGSYTDLTAVNPLMPTEISNYLALGTGYNAQIGYATKSGYAVDFSYSGVSPEFTENELSVIGETTAWTLGLSKYFKGNALKIQSTVSQITDANDMNTLGGTLIFQLIF